MLSNQTLVDVLTFLAGFVLLAGGAELLVRGSTRIAARMNISSVVIGLTVVAFGTSLPELLVSVVANIEGDGGSAIAIGNIVGSNIGNLGLILGIASLLAVPPVDNNMLRREFPLMVVVTAGFILLAWNGEVSRLDGLVLLAGLAVFTYYTYTSAVSTQHKYADESLHVVETIDKGIARPSRHVLRDAGLVVIGLLGLVVGAEWLVTASESIARAIGVSDLVIGLSLVALGTSLPELATTVVAVVRNEKGIAVGNVVGSNLFNMLSIGGLAAIIRPLPVPLHMRVFDFPVLMGITVLAFVLALPVPHQYDRWKGALLVGCYLAYLVALFTIKGPLA